MQQPLTAEYTPFTLDTMGRYLANTLQEALDSSAATLGDSRRDFDAIVIGGGTLRPVTAPPPPPTHPTHTSPHPPFSPARPPAPPPHAHTVPPWVGARTPPAP